MPSARPLLRQAWPGTFCCRACTWTQLSSSNKAVTHRNCTELKPTACTRMLSGSGSRRQKRPKTPNAACEEPGAKAGGRERKQITVHACPLHTAPLRGGQPPKPPCKPTPGHCPALTPCKAPAHPDLRERVREPVTCSPSLLPQQGLQIALPEFLVWPLIYSCWLWRGKNACG